MFKTKQSVSVVILLCVILLAFLLLSRSSCSPNTAERSKRGSVGGSSRPYNITILLDLSDRDLSNNKPMLTTDIPIKHDTTALRIILSDLEETFRSLTIKDKVTVECVYMNNANYNDYFSANYQKFKIDMADVFNDLKKQNRAALSIPLRKKEFEQRSGILINSVAEIENIALRNRNPSGGDITEFLRDKLQYFFQPDYQNVLVILTDGDEAFNSNVQMRRGKFDLRGNFAGLKVLMLGINVPNLSTHPEELPTVYREWRAKFQPIGVDSSDVDLNQVTDISLIDTKVKQFVK